MGLEEARAMKVEAIQATQTRRMRLMMPVHDWVVCALVKEEIVSPGGIIHPGDIGVAGSNVVELAVLAVGPTSPSKLRQGDRLKVVGKPPPFMCDGEVYYPVRDSSPGFLPVEKVNIADGVEFLPIGQPYIICVIRADENPEQEARELQ